MDDLKLKLGYDKMLTVDPIGRSGGLALMWKNTYKEEILLNNKRIINAKVKLGSLIFYLSCVYGDLVRKNRKEVWDQLIDIGI